MKTWDIDDKVDAVYEMRMAEVNEAIRAGGAASGGLTVRDYFAAQALIGGGYSRIPSIMAKRAYEIADAMMAEREKPFVKYNSFLDRDIADLEMTVRTENACRASDIFTIGQLAKKSERHLSMLPGIGKKCVKEIKSVLAQHQIDLATDYSVEEAFGL